MSATELRAAASLMRQRANLAAEYAFLSPGDMTGWVCDGSWIMPDDELISEHYAPLSPPVALAVADWLDSVARAERKEINGADIHNALAVARAYLGEST